MSKFSLLMKVVYQINKVINFAIFPSNDGNTRTSNDEFGILGKIKAAKRRVWSRPSCDDKHYSCKLEEL